MVDDATAEYGDYGNYGDNADYENPGRDYDPVDGFVIALAMSIILVQVWAIKVAHHARKAIEEAGK